jgi:hypothetical protein
MSSKDKIIIKKAPIEYDKMFYEQTPTGMGIVSSGSWTIPELDKKTKKKNNKKFFL